jgi:phosphoserine phosphatase RsbU/P
MLRMQDRVREIAVEVRTADGGRLPVLVNAVLKRSDEGMPLVVRVAVFDATERRAYEGELLRARQRAEDSEARARSLARTLQASFIPPEPPSVPGLDVAARYRPAGDGDEVGGDFYDVFETGGGDWAVILGDVRGKGVAAATVTSLVRYTVRAAAVQPLSPSQVLRLLNAAIIRQHVDRFCTASYVAVERTPDGPPRLVISSGGHPLPLLVSSGADVSPVGEPGTLLGAFEEVELDEATVALGPGEALVLYTDGVTEAQQEDGTFFGEQRLHDTLAAWAGRSADDMADHIVAEVLAFQHGTPRDDIAVVVLKNPASTTPAA